MCTSVGGAGLPRLDDEVWHNKRHQEPDHAVLGDVDIYKTVGWPLPSVGFLVEGHQTVQMCTCFHCSPVLHTFAQVLEIKANSMRCHGGYTLKNVSIHLPFRHLGANRGFAVPVQSNFGIRSLL